MTEPELSAATTSRYAACSPRRATTRRCRRRWPRAWTASWPTWPPSATPHPSHRHRWPSRHAGRRPRGPAPSPAGRRACSWPRPPSSPSASGSAAVVDRDAGDSGASGPGAASSERGLDRSDARRRREGDGAAAAAGAVDRRSRRALDRMKPVAGAPPTPSPPTPSATAARSGAPVEEPTPLSARTSRATLVATGPGVLVPVLYDGMEAVLAYRPPTDDAQVVDLLQCGTGDVLRTTTLPVP